MTDDYIRTSSTAVEPDTRAILTPKLVVTTDLSALAALFQHSAEICERETENELTPALQWLLKGMALAHGFDAKRTRDLNQPVVAGRPPRGDLGLIQAYELMVKLLQAMGTTEVKAEPECPPAQPHSGQ